ncbi:MAG: Flp pilus assembly complex ATPase component TadA [Alphaproteobacteria bacterium]|nr:Flp pilus assembly complex ATPase component TadA [Alphaproteobacteria bacterium]
MDNYVTRSRFRHYVVEEGHVTLAQMEAALREQSHHPHKKLGQILCHKGFLTESKLIAILSDYTGVPAFPGMECMDKDILDDPDYQETPHTHHALPFKKDAMGLHVALLDPENILIRDQLHHQFKEKIIPYGVTEKVFAVLKEIIHDAPNRAGQGGAVSPQHDLNSLVMEAIRAHASDIHFQPTATHLVIRLRVDGMLKPMRELHSDYWGSLRTQIKILASMDVAEERKPQHGRFYQDFAGRTIDFRVSSHPTVSGENIVIRILDKYKTLLSFDSLGFSHKHKQILRHCIKHNHGIILFTGPTGSGKTTSLYGLLSEMDSKTRNIMTLEQPVEYAISGIRQSEITQNMSFSEGVRSLLRQDPDVILIGEIRDEDTAQMAIRASMTGHLVLSTLHTHDVLSAPYRLMNLGISEDLLASHLLSVVSQRLVRKICTQCYHKGCERCDYTGFCGRTCLSECLFIDESMRRDLGSDDFMKRFKEYGKETLWDDAMLKINEGLTTQIEVERVLGPRLISKAVPMMKPTLQKDIQ